MKDKDTLMRWGAVCAIVSGVVFLVPLVFYFYLLPLAGSSATHAQDPFSFLPWMAVHGGVRVALWWSVCLAFLIVLFGVPFALRRKLEILTPTAAQIAELVGCKLNSAMNYLRGLIGCDSITHPLKQAQEMSYARSAAQQVHFEIQG